MTDVPIPEFPDYTVNEYGVVWNQRLNRRIQVRVNRDGIAFVGLSRDGEQYSRSLATLVAEEFVPAPSGQRSFNTPTHMNGDKFDCRASNLMWRPRAWSIRYHQQFYRPYRNTIRTPVIEEGTGQQYSTSMDAAVANGLLDRDVCLSTLNIINGCFPTGQSFWALEEE